jgi:hypothetical protein
MLAGMVAVTSKEPITFGVALEISRASISKEGLKVESFNSYSPTLM